MSLKPSLMVVMFGASKFMHSSANQLAFDDALNATVAPRTAWKMMANDDTALVQAVIQRVAPASMMLPLGLTTWEPKADAFRVSLVQALMLTKWNVPGKGMECCGLKKEFLSSDERAF